MADTWNNPSVAAVRKALEDWPGSGGVKMAEIEVFHIDAKTGEQEDGEDFAVYFKEFGTHIFVRTIYEKNGKEVGRCRLRYLADGTAYLEHVYLDPAVARTGVMTQLLADFLPHYREWGLTKVRNPTPFEAGQKFAEAQGYKPADKKKTAYELEVPAE